MKTSLLLQALNSQNPCWQSSWFPRQWGSHGLPVPKWKWWFMNVHWFNTHLPSQYGDGAWKSSSFSSLYWEVLSCGCTQINVKIAWMTRWMSVQTGECHNAYFSFRRPQSVSYVVFLNVTTPCHRDTNLFLYVRIMLLESCMSVRTLSCRDTRRCVQSTGCPSFPTCDRWFVVVLDTVQLQVHA